MKHFRTIFLSDVHLGTRGSQAVALLSFLKEHKCDKIYIVGDFIDFWSMQRKTYWPQAHSDVIQKLLKRARGGTEIIYIPGNHDETCLQMLGFYGDRIKIMKDDIHVCADGRKILVMHGHEFDFVIRSVKWLAFLGDIGYEWLIRMNSIVRWIQKSIGLKTRFSLSQYVKSVVKRSVNVIGNFEKALCLHAERNQVDGVLCGHIHTPVITRIGKTMYYNTGDWVESNTAIVESEDGTLELIEWLR